MTEIKASELKNMTQDELINLIHGYNAENHGLKRKVDLLKYWVALYMSGEIRPEAELKFKEILGE